ncbi:MAG: TAXI family TRAP transporter solute-binding subunit [Halanaerobiales bacterium]|nr:TAXI family TRAP transporter solute-binding subunit [Halanaerobiales bacterium]
MNRKIMFLMLVASLILVLSIPAMARTQFISIATGGTGGTYYPLGGGMAEIFNEFVPNVNATAEVSGASVENSRLVQNQEVELAFVQNDIAYYASTGTELFAGKSLSDIRGVAMLYPEIIQIITTENSKINSVNDFKGKRIAVGAPGSGVEANARQVIEAYGLTYKDMTVDYLSFSEAVDQLKDGHVDAAFLTAGIPTAAVIDLAATHEVKILNINNEIVDKLIAKYPFYTKAIIPAKTYSGQVEPVQTVTVKAMLITNKNLDEELVYNLTKSLFGNLDRLSQIHAKGAAIDLYKALIGMPIELHPGSKKFFREVFKDVIDLLND